MQQIEAESQQQARIKIVLIYILHHFKNNLTLEQLAGIACMSPSHFHRLFKSYTGESVYAYIKKIRLEYAALCLLRSSEPPGNIAFSSGYSNVSAFSKAFKQYYGISPQDFRNVDDSFFTVSQKSIENIYEWEEV